MQTANSTTELLNETASTTNNNNNNAMPIDDIEIISDAAPVLTMQEKTALALLQLASYFSQFAATKNADTKIGMAKQVFKAPLTFTGLNRFTNYIGITAPTTELQGFTETTQQSFDNAKASFEKAKSFLKPIDSLELDVLGKKQYAKELVSKLLDEAQGDRFPRLFNDWLNLFNQPTLKETKEFIQTSQLILNDTFVHINDFKQTDPEPATTASLLTLNVTEKLKSDAAQHSITLRFDAFGSDTSNSSINTLYIEGRAHASIFEAMGTLAEKTNLARLVGTESAKSQNIAHARLLSIVKRQPNPTNMQSYRALYSTLDSYTKMKQALNTAAFDASKGTQAATNDFLLHCAIIQTLLLTLADNSQNREDSCNKHWNSYETAETKDLLADLKKTLHRPGLPFKDAMNQLSDFSAKLVGNDHKIEAATFTKKSFIEDVEAFMTGNDAKTHAKLLKTIIRYTEALGAEEFVNSIELYRNSPAVTSVFDPDLALQYIATMKAYITSPAFTQSFSVDAAPVVSNTTTVTAVSSTSAPAAVISQTMNPVFQPTSKSSTSNESAASSKIVETASLPQKEALKDDDNDADDEQEKVKNDKDIDSPGSITLESKTDELSVEERQKKFQELYAKTKQAAEDLKQIGGKPFIPSTSTTATTTTTTTTTTATTNPVIYKSGFPGHNINSNNTNNTNNNNNSKKKK